MKFPDGPILLMGEGDETPTLGSYSAASNHNQVLLSSFKAS